MAVFSAVVVASVVVDVVVAVVVDAVAVSGMGVVSIATWAESSILNLDFVRKKKSRTASYFDKSLSKQNGDVGQWREGKTKVEGCHIGLLSVWVCECFIMQRKLDKQCTLQAWYGKN